MRTIALSTVLVASFIVVVACGKKDETPPPTAPTASASAYPPGYPPGAYPQPTYTQPAPTGPAPTAPPGTTSATMAVPGPLAFPCQENGASNPCGLHKCNGQYGKCAFPCANADADCVPGNACNFGLCVPKAPGQ